MKQLLTVEQLAEILQMNEKVIRRKCAAGTLPHHRIGKAIRFDLDAVLAACAGRYIEPLGWRLVPTEPTEEMAWAAVVNGGWDSSKRQFWDALLEAAPVYGVTV